MQLHYDSDFQAFGMSQTLSAGINAQKADYARYSNGRFVPDQSQQKLGTVHDNSAFVAATLRPVEGLAFNAGMRSDRFSTGLSDEKFTNTCTYTTVFIPFPIPVLVSCTPFAFIPQNLRKGTWRNHGSELGVTWEPHARVDCLCKRHTPFPQPEHRRAGIGVG